MLGSAWNLWSEKTWKICRTPWTDTSNCPSQKGIRTFWPARQGARNQLCCTKTTLRPAPARRAFVPFGLPAKVHIISTKCSALPPLLVLPVRSSTGRPVKFNCTPSVLQVYAKTAANVNKAPFELPKQLPSFNCTSLTLYSFVDGYRQEHASIYM